jgi:hypothetical protein
MRHTSRRRQSYDPLAPIDAATWLVVRDQMSFVLECTELAYKSDLRAVLTPLETPGSRPDGKRMISAPSARSSSQVGTVSAFS